MARGSQQASGAATSAQNISNASSANANALYGTLAPELQAEAAHPQGFSPTDLAAKNTAAQQSAGGSTAGAVGQGSLLASRNKNAGGFGSAIAQSARTAQQALSQRAVENQGENADLKAKQQQAGLGGLESLYSGNLGTSVNALGQVAGNVNANTNAENASWNWTKPFGDILGAAGGAIQPIKL